MKSVIFISRNPDFSALPFCVLKCTDWPLANISQPSDATQACS